MAELNELLEALQSEDESRAEAAALQLPAFGQAAQAGVRSLLASPRADTRWWAVRALAELPGELAGQDLCTALDDADPAVRCCAAQGLSQRPNEKAIAPLVQALRSDNHLLVRLAGNALVQTGAAAVPALIELLSNPQATPARMEAARALALIADPRAIPALYAVLEEDSALLEYWANQGLERMGVGMLFFKP